MTVCEGYARQLATDPVCVHTFKRTALCCAVLCRLSKDCLLTPGEPYGAGCSVSVCGGHAGVACVEERLAVGGGYGAERRQRSVAGCGGNLLGRRTRLGRAGCDSGNRK